MIATRVSVWDIALVRGGAWITRITLVVGAVTFVNAWAFKCGLVNVPYAIAHSSWHMLLGMAVACIPLCIDIPDEKPVARINLYLTMPVKRAHRPRSESEPLLQLCNEYTVNLETK